MSCPGWRVMRRPTSRHGATAWRFPGIIEILIAASTITGTASDIDADVVIRPPVSDFGFLDFSAAPQIIEAGYRHTVELLEDLASA